MSVTCIYDMFSFTCASCRKFSFCNSRINGSFLAELMGESELNEAQDLNKIAIKNGLEPNFSLENFRDEWKNDRAIVTGKMFPSLRYIIGPLNSTVLHFIRDLLFGTAMT